ncbi:hypothetical protein Rctr85_007 [Virus Rctr85]|nr:hypothetical protein Rctr85_007 [Virus Rctr85]
MPRTKTSKASKTDRVKVIDVTLDLPDSVTEPRQMRIVMDRQAIETARKATDEFTISRRLPLDSENVSVSDPLALLILAQNKDISGSDAAYKAGRTYERWVDEARREALVVAMTMHTETTREPSPYEEGWDADDDDDTPAWLRDDVKLPKPERNLANRYEARLKVIYDILDEAGPLFTAKFNDILNDDLAVKLREMGVGSTTDEAGFRTSGTSS